VFDIGFSELVLLMLVGLVVLGPKRLPIAIRTVMGWVKTIRGLAANVQNELKQELKLQELQDSIKKAEALNLQTLSPELNKTVEELKAQADKMRAELEAKAAEAGTTVEEQIEAGTTVEEQIKEIKSTAENAASSANLTECESMQTQPKSVEKGSEASDLTTLEAHEQAELTERLSDYYPPDETEVAPAPKPQSKESQS